jgi:hypothetical protein
VGLLIPCSQELGGSNPSPRARLLFSDKKQFLDSEWVEEKLKKLPKLAQKMLQLGCVLYVRQLEESLSLVKLPKKEENVQLVIKSLNYKI